MSHSKSGKHHIKTIDKIKMACRLSMMNLGMSDAAIARHIGMSQTSYSILKKTKIFNSIHDQFLTGILSEADSEIVDNFALQAKILNAGVPVALENLLALAAQKIDPKLRLEASKEILDRHGRFAKVSRIGLPSQDQGGVGTPKDNEVASEVIQAFAKQKRQETNEIVLTEQPPPSIESPPITEIKQ